MFTPPTIAAPSPPPTSAGAGSSLPTAERSEFAAQGVYRLLRAIDTGRYGTGYAGVELATNRQVEVRRIAAALPSRDRDELTVRLRLNELLEHQAARRSMLDSMSPEEPVVVVDGVLGKTLRDYLGEASLEPVPLLKVLADVVYCVNEAHELGLTHGALASETIGLEHGSPRIDFTGYQQSGALESGQGPELLGSPEAKVSDAQSLACLVDDAIQGRHFYEACGEISHRETARLKQLCAAFVAQETDGRDLTLLAECLETLANPKDGSAAAEPPVIETTNELPAFLLPSQAGDSTAEIVVQPSDKVDGTAELGLAGQAPVMRAPAQREPQAGDRLGRYQIERKLGQGGMGAVFKALDLGTQKPVAIKVLSEAAMGRGNAVQRFEKEARLLASVNNPYITNLIEVCTEGSQRFIALEFVDGVDLKGVLDNQGPLPERTALSLVADVARALVDAHHREIVHRDIKPENVLLVGVGPEDTVGETPPQAKLTDFGIARHIDQSESLAVTQAGSILGTPMYMSPEQCKGQGEVAPSSDVYSAGVTLFELLTGRPPFSADDPMTIAGMHCFDAPPPVRKLCPEVSEPTADLVAKCLAKKPTNRYADAGHLLKELDRLLRGETSSVALRPVMPVHDASRVVSSRMTWRLESSPEALWPYVANTERLNRAIGLPPVDYRTETDLTGRVQRFGTIRLAGFSMTWEEHPFEWIEGQRMSVLREFQGGPFQWFVSTVELKPLAKGGTELTHTARILPRHILGKLIARIETGTKCRRALQRVYTRIDGVLNSQSIAQNFPDAFEKPVTLRRTQRDVLLARLADLKSSGADPDMAQQLADYLLSAPDQGVAKIRPIALAQLLNLDEATVVDTCLRAVVQGLLKMQWDILCPTCRVAADSRDSLKQLTAHTNCEACNYDFQSSVADAVELVFRADADIRDTDIGRYCIGGPWHAPHVVAQLRFEPGERIELELNLPAGEYLLRGPRLSQSLGLNVQPTGAPSQQLFVLAPDAGSSRSYNLRSGKQLLTIENHFDLQQIVRIERTIARDDVLTAARASALPQFRELFPGEVLDSGRLVEADQVTLLAATIVSIDDLYAKHGDAQAFTIVEEHLADFTNAVRLQRGEVVKVIGETAVASFHDTRHAVRAAFALRDMSKSDGNGQATIGVGVHRGPALVTTANNRLDYFGATARQATALPALAGPGVTLTEAVFSDPKVAKLLTEISEVAELETLSLPGKPNQLIQRFPLN